MCFRIFAIFIERGRGHGIAHHTPSHATVGGCWVLDAILSPPRTQHSCILNLCKSVTFYHHRHFEVHHQTDITMKFLSAALLALAHGSEASKFSTSDLNRMVESGKIDKQRLLRNAIPVARKMENYNNQQYNNGGNANANYNNNYQANNNNNANQYQQNNNQNNGNNYAQYDNYVYGDDGYANNTQADQYATETPVYNQSYAVDDDGWQYNLPFNGNYTFRFNKCLSFSIEDEDILSDSELVYYANTEALVSQKSYVLFDIEECEPGSCVFDEADLSKIHIVPLEDFINSFIEFFPNQQAAYCEQCLNHYSYCSTGQGSYFDNVDFENDGAFCYGGHQYEMINCGQCWDMGCFAGGGGDDNGMDDVSAWIEEMAGCKATNTNWQDFPLYTGLTCNSEGDGVEFGVFLDQGCKQYLPERSFEKVVAADDWTLLVQSPSIIEDMFTSSMTCRDGSEIRYMNAYQPVYGSDGSSSYNQQEAEAEAEFEQEVNAEGNDCGLGESINLSCLDLFQDNVKGLSLANCLNTAPSWYYSANGNATAADDDGQSYNGDINSDWKKIGLYSYDLSTSDLNDMGKVCHLVAKKYRKGNHQNVFNEEGSGSMFDYSAAKSNYDNKDGHDNVVNTWGVSPNALSFGEKFIFYLFGIIGACLLVLGAVRVFKKNTTPAVETLGKDIPLIS